MIQFENWSIGGSGMKSIKAKNIHTKVNEDSQRTSMNSEASREGEKKKPLS